MCAKKEKFNKSISIRGATVIFRNVDVMFSVLYYAIKNYF